MVVALLPLRLPGSPTVFGFLRAYRKGGETETFRVHGILFAAASGVFEKLLYGGMAESRSGQVALTDINPVTFGALREYVYTGEVLLAPDNVCDVLAAARQYGLDALLDACMEHVSSSLDTDNVRGRSFLPQRLATSRGSSAQRGFCGASAAPLFARLRWELFFFLVGG